MFVGIRIAPAVTLDRINTEMSRTFYPHDPPWKLRASCSPEGTAFSLSGTQHSEVRSTFPLQHLALATLGGRILDQMDH